MPLDGETTVGVGRGRHDGLVVLVTADRRPDRVEHADDGERLRADASRSARPGRAPEELLAPSSRRAPPRPAPSVSSAVGEEPARRHRPGPHLAATSGVVPTTVVVQFVPFGGRAMSDVVDVGATARDVGRHRRVASIAASAVGEGGRGTASAAHAGEAGRARPGETMSRFEPSLSIWRATCCCAPWPRPTVSITAAIPIRMPSMVRAERIRRVRIASQPVRRVSSQLTGAPGPARPCRAGGRRAMLRRLRAGARARATSCSWVIRTIVRPCALSSSKRSSTSAVDGRVQVAGRLVGEDQLWVGDQGAGHRDALLLAAGELARPVVDPVGRGRPGSSASSAPVACARPGGSPA